MNIRTLQADDAERLLAFELENRQWFERHVEARAVGFYTPGGVAAHIADYLRDYTAGVMHPCVLAADDGAIIGRANLRRIDAVAGSAEVGYRIAHSQARKGLASGALEHLKELARTRYGLRMLNAWIAAENLGSARVMEKCHFTRATLTPPVAVIVNGGAHNSYLYQCHL
jgi:ribosomal-protein-alanine N-acetyltransferase